MVTAASSSILELIRRAVDDPRAPELPDPELLRRFHAQQDHAAFHALLLRHGPMVLDVCRGVLGNEADAEDAFQATFLVLVRKVGSIRKTASLGSWLHGVAHRTALKARAQSAARHEHEARVPPRQSSEPDDLSWQEVRQAVHEELSGLPNRYRAPLVLCYLEGATQEACAGQLGLASSTLRERLERGRALLRARLVRRGLGPVAVLVAATWPAANTSASVPLSLMVFTVEAASLFAAGQVAATGPVGPTVAALTEGVLKAMKMSKIKAIVAIMLLLGFVTTGTTILMLPPIDSSRQVAHAAPVPAERLRGPNKILAFRAGHVALLDPDGKNDQQVTPLPKYIQRARLSPDGKKIAALILTRSKEPALRRTGEEGAQLSTLHVRGLDENEDWTNLEVECQSFAWSPDGIEIACSDCKNGFATMDYAGLDPKSFAGRNPKSPEATHFVINVATKEKTALKLSENSEDHIITDWSLDGKHFLTTSIHGPAGARGTRLYLMNRDGTLPTALTDGKEPAMYGRLSPDGKRVLYRTLTAVPEETRPAKLGLVLAVHDIASGKMERVEESGDVYSFCWSPDGKRIAYGWRQTHEGTKEEIIDKETDAYIVLCDPDGKNRKTITTVKGFRGPMPGPRLWDWR